MDAPKKAKRVMGGVPKTPLDVVHETPPEVLQFITGLFSARYSLGDTPELSLGIRLTETTRDMASFLMQIVESVAVCEATAAVGRRFGQGKSNRPIAPLSETLFVDEEVFDA